MLPSDRLRWLRDHVTGLRPWTAHSKVLMVAGFVFLGIGLAYLLSDLNDERMSSLRLHLAIFPLEVWGLIYFAVGAASLLSSRWPPASETWGYTAMTGLSSAWGALFGLSVIPIPVHGFSAPLTNLVSLLVWTMVAYLWRAISGLVAPINQRERVLVITVDPLEQRIDSQSFEVDRKTGEIVLKEAQER